MELFSIRIQRTFQLVSTDISRWMTRKEYRISFTTKVIVTITGMLAL